MLDISPVLLLVTTSVFLILLITLNKILYRPLLEFITNRNDSIKRDLDDAGKNASDVSAYYNEADKIILEAKAEASKIRSAAYESAKSIASDKIEQRKAELDEEYAAFLKDLDAERTEFKNGLSAQMPIFKEGVKAKLGQI